MRKLVFYILPILFLVASCQSRNYSTTKVESVDFSQYKTYSWLQPVDSLSKNYFNNDIARSNILDQANNSLEQMGLTYNKENPDILFRYIAIVNNKMNSYHTYPYYYGYPYVPYYSWRGYVPGAVRDDIYRLGHVIVEARERSSYRLIWQARGTYRVDQPEKAMNNLTRVVERVMKQYPLDKK